MSTNCMPNRITRHAWERNAHLCSRHSNVGQCMHGSPSQCPMWKEGCLCCTTVHTVVWYTSHVPHISVMLYGRFDVPFEFGQWRQKYLLRLLLEVWCQLTHHHLQIQTIRTEVCLAKSRTNMHILHGTNAQTECFQKAIFINEFLMHCICKRMCLSLAQHQNLCANIHTSHMYALISAYAIHFTDK